MRHVRLQLPAPDRPASDVYTTLADFGRSLGIPPAGSRS